MKMNSIEIYYVETYSVNDPYKEVKFIQYIPFSRMVCMTHGNDLGLWQHQ